MKLLCRYYDTQLVPFRSRSRWETSSDPKCWRIQCSRTSSCPRPPKSRSTSPSRSLRAPENSSGASGADHTETTKQNLDFEHAATTAVHLLFLEARSLLPQHQRFAELASHHSLVLIIHDLILEFVFTRHNAETLYETSSLNSGGDRLQSVTRKQASCQFWHSRQSANSAREWIRSMRNLAGNGSENQI